MPHLVKESKQTDRCGFKPYRDDIEYLEDKLRSLDLRIHLYLLKEQSRLYRENPLDQWKGVVLADRNMMGLLEPEDGGIGEIDEDEDEAESGKIPPATYLREELQRLETWITGRKQASAQAGMALGLPSLTAAFRLTEQEERCLLICAAPEINRKYERLYGYMQGYAGAGKPCPDLALKLLSEDFREQARLRSILETDAPLMAGGLLQWAAEPEYSHAGGGLTSALRVDPRVVRYLLGSLNPDASPLPWITSLAPAGKAEVEEGEEAADEISPEISELADRIILFLSKSNHAGNVRSVLYLHGPEGSGKAALLRRVAARLGSRLLLADLDALKDSRVPLETQLCALRREAILQSALVGLTKADACRDSDSNPSPRALSLPGLARQLDGCPGPLFLLAREPWNGAVPGEGISVLEIPMPSFGRKKRLEAWRRFAAPYAVDDELLREMATKYRFSAGQIREALQGARLTAAWRSPETVRLEREDLDKACGRHVHHRLHLLADRLQPTAGWEDLILPPEQRIRLKEVIQHAAHRELVYEDWGFGRKYARGKGLNVLFHGPPGTGKTTAAEVLAGELGLELFRIDLSQIVSKYIGETEKNLQNVFQEAGDSYAILFFDEADALFGKRTEVKDANDRHANTEVAYLLQKMEEYDGVTILATNLHAHLDEAFIRRMRFSIEFPFPDEKQRLRLWEAMFPKTAPLMDNVDLPFMAKAFKLAGGNIRNIALGAAFYAADEGKSIGMDHVVRATRRELEKMGKLWRKEDFGHYAGLLP